MSSSPIINKHYSTWHHHAVTKLAADSSRSTTNTCIGDDDDGCGGAAAASSSSNWKDASNKNKSRRKRRNNHRGEIQNQNCSIINEDKLSKKVWTPHWVKPIKKPMVDDENKVLAARMLILVGIPGSGKSTFAYSLEKAMPWKYRRINQDSLKSRQRCESLCKKVLSEGYVAVIDRCNFDQTQRGHFLNIAQKMGVSVDCIVFDYSVEECISRCNRRTNHETIKPGEAAPIVRRMKTLLKPPTPTVKHDQLKSIASFQNSVTLNETNEISKSGKQSNTKQSVVVGTHENFRSVVVIDHLDKANAIIRKYLKI